MLWYRGLCSTPPRTAWGLHTLQEVSPSQSCWILPFLQASNRIYTAVLHKFSVISWRLGFSFCFAWVRCFWNTPLLTLSVSCGVLILLWSPAQAAGSKVFSEGVFSSICSCIFIDPVCPSASLDTVTTFHFPHNTSWHANSRWESRYMLCNSVLDLVKGIKLQITGEKRFGCQVLVFCRAIPEAVELWM